LQFNYYSILEIPKNATLAQIKNAYKELAKKYHPDKNDGDPIAEEKFKLINEAYQTLSDPVKKEKYDWQFYGNVTTERNHTYQYQTSYTTNYHRNFDFGRYQPKFDEAIKPSRNPQKGNIKFYILAFVFIFIIGSIGLTIGFFMNKYAAKQHLENGNQFLKSKMYFQANSEYTAALQFDEKLAEAYFGRGKVILEATLNTEKALEEFNKAIEVSDSSNPLFHEKRAYCLYNIQLYPQALADINITLQNIQFQTGPNFYFRGMCKTKIGYDKESCTDFQTAFKLNFERAEEKIMQYCD
jgi:curved DNA-binding protein CbpA